jgi:predicted nuclease of predicted toxin-antitoxin system
MKLLFDQNLSHKLAAHLAVEFPESAHVRDFGSARATDAVVWAHAAAMGFVIVSKDVDFQQRALLLGYPPNSDSIAAQANSRQLSSWSAAKDLSPPSYSSKFI